MNAIHLLDADTIGRIAAGEVVERPAAAAKELVENALDAGATAITVEVREGGLQLLRVTDNGCGIPESDVVLAFSRHATSKIRSGDPLTDIATLGFRGEALPSIAAVAEVTLKSRVPGSAYGLLVNVSGGMVGDVRPCGCPEGTSIEVRELFGRTPARLKFLHKPGVEAGYVADVVAQMALSHPRVAFRFLSGGKLMLHTPGDGSARGAVACVYGREVAQHMIPISGREGYVLVSGFVGVGEWARGNRGHQTFFVNTRAVRSDALRYALESACRERVLTARYPICVLHVDLPPAQLDVNVHPNKLEVRFSDEGFVRSAVQIVLREALERAAQAPPSADAPTPAAEASTAEAAAAPQPDAPPQAAPPAPAVRPPLPRFTVPEPLPPQELPRIIVEPRALPRLREDAQTVLPLAPPPNADIVGQALRTYIVIDAGDRLLLMDQHAAHERLLFERFTRSLQEGHGAQPLLSPYLVELSLREKAAVLEEGEALGAIGFDLSDAPGNAVEVRAVPHILGKPQLQAFFMDMVDKLSDIRGAKPLDVKRDALVRLACRKAVKGGDPLTPAQIRSLVRDAQEAPPTCPHGRPIYIAITRAELERRFGRTQ